MKMSEVSDENVVELFEKPLDVKNIEKLLEYAKAGKLKSLAMVGQLDDGSLISGFSLHAGAKPFSLIGRLQVMTNEIGMNHT